MALLDTNLIGESLSDPHELHLAAVIAAVMLEFLRGMSCGAVFV